MRLSQDFQGFLSSALPSWGSRPGSDIFQCL